MIIDKVRRELARHDKPENKIYMQRFFKEKLDDPYGLKGDVFRKISNDCFKEIASEPKKQILEICNRMVESEERYMRGIAIDWAGKIHAQFVKSDFGLFERWLKGYVNNWGACDSLCCGPIGRIVLKFPELSRKTIKWTSSKNRWVKRGAAVSLILPVKDGLLLDYVFRTADILLTDEDDMVQKGYGWMLKDASIEFPNEVFAYVMKHKAVMPRTALRYAIERFPAAKRKQAMKK